MAAVLILHLQHRCAGEYHSGLDSPEHLQALQQIIRSPVENVRTEEKQKSGKELEEARGGRTFMNNFRDRVHDFRMFCFGWIPGSFSFSHHFEEI